MIAANGDTLARLETHVEQLWRAGRHDAAAAWAEIAADFAAWNHPGRFASSRLERVLGEIGRRAICSGRTADTDGSPRRVLHVLTEAYQTGGHTRFAWRWITGDPEREHSLVLTTPGAQVPDWLEDSVADVTVLESAAPIARAQELRTLADGFDAVVLHVHMYDVVPVIAFAHRPAGPAVVFEEHADHLFWLGTSVADVVTNGRAAGRRLNVERRQVAPGRAVALPVPIPPFERTLTRAGAKRRLGIPASAPVLLTIAVPHKFMRVGPVGFCDLVEPVLQARDDAVLIAVGPREEGEWAELARRTGGRVRAVGLQRDLTVFHHAADVYLDSYPFGSNTAMLEAAGHGVPVASFSPDPDAHGLLMSNFLGMEDSVVLERTPADYAARVTELLADPALRAELGDGCRDGMERAHSGAAWDEALVEVYARAAELGPAALQPPRRDADVVEDFEAVHTLLFAAQQGPVPLGVVASRRARVLPAEHLRDIVLPPAAPAAAWHAVAFPGMSDDQLTASVERLAELSAAHALNAAAIALPPDAVEDAVPTLEAVLADHPELTMDLLPTADPESLLAFGGVCVADGALAALAAERGIAVVSLTAAGEPAQAAA